MSFVCFLKSLFLEHIDYCARMKVYLVLVTLCMSIMNILGQGACRAIPIATKNFVVDLFHRVNSRVEYDSTNFLVELSGNYANCSCLKQHYTLIDEKTPEGGSIGVIQDYTRGAETHCNAVNGYLQTVFKSWVHGNDVVTSDFLSQIQSADKFGCSVSLGCGGQLSIVCLFTPSRILENMDERLAKKGTEGKQRAKAFTSQQYKVAGQLTEQDWESSHFLENLSGFETQCSMVSLNHWDFPYATEVASLHDYNVTGLYGSEQNTNSTQTALEKILKGMKVVDFKRVGCSLIPDCFVPGNTNMYIVVSCMFET